MLCFDFCYGVLEIDFVIEQEYDFICYFFYKIYDVSSDEYYFVVCFFLLDQFFKLYYCYWVKFGGWFIEYDDGVVVYQCQGEVYFLFGVVGEGV